MNLDARTLLFSLILTNAFMVVSLFVAASSKDEDEKPDGIAKWAVAILLQTLAWILIAARGGIPDAFSIVVANGFLSGSYALMLAAVGEFQQRTVPRWKYFVPIALTLLVSAILINDIHARFIWGGMVYIFQLLLFARTLLTAQESHTGRAWKLLISGIAVVIVVLLLRAIVAMTGQVILAQPSANDAPHWIQVVSFVALMGSSLLGSIGFLLMVKERTDREVLHLAMTDSLTGVPNRRALMDYAERALAQRGGRSMALLMIDIDHFKRINDTRGHPAGDEALRQISRLLSKRLRGGDLLGRYGGEEFCVVAPDTDADGALKLGESLRATLESAELTTESGKISVTVSIGVALSAANAERELKDILAEADVALYSAKKGGRNQVVCFS
jgi:diguanylate cyclase (GGDEF)-like protein